MGNAIPAEIKDLTDGRVRQHRFRYHMGRGFVTPVDTVIDVGCGTGYGTSILSEVAFRVIGVDKEESNVVYAKKNHQTTKNEFLCTNVEEWEIPECDVVCAFESLEHLYKPAEFVRKLKEKTKKFIVFSVPLGQSLEWNEADGEYQERGDSTHKSVFAMDASILELFLDDEWRLFYGLRDGVTFMGVVYKTGEYDKS